MLTSTQSDTGMHLRDLLTDPEFPMRSRRSGPANRQTVALRRLARIFAESPDRILQELVDIAVEFCGADSAGISLEEMSDGAEPRFRWIVVAGSFAPYLNGTTPRFYSPCGTCIDSGRPQLYRVTQPYYDFLGVEAQPIEDGLLIPWQTDLARGTLWAVSHRSEAPFDVEDYNLLDTLADFAAIALRHQRQQEELRAKEREAASTERAHQMAHLINNPLQSLTNAIYLAQQSGPDGHIHLQQAALELATLSSLVRRILTPHD